MKLEWRLVADWDDWQRELARRHAPDVLLGGRVESLGRLASGGRLAAVRNDGPTPWFTIRSSEIRLADRSGQPAGQWKQPRAEPGKRDAGTTRSGVARSVTFDDPRSDPISRAWAASLLDSEHFREGYAQLVQSAGSPRRIGRRMGAASGAVERGEAALSPLLVADRAGSKGDHARLEIGAVGSTDRERLPEATVPPRLVEGVAIVAGGANAALAAEFLRFLVETCTDRPGADPSSAGLQVAPELDDLLADLVGTTIVDAQDELWAAWAALDRAADTEPARKWMTEPPPWPPASIAELLKRGDSAALNLVDALAREIAPEAAVRAELVRSWLAPARVIDRGVLAEVAHLADGRLAAEPRFRAWLSAEWTIWARQRFRRVERLALSGRPPAPSPKGSKTKS